MPASPRVEGAEGRIILTFESLEQAMRIFQPWHGGRQRAEAASQVRQALGAIGLTLEVRVNNRSIAEVGPDGMHGSLLRLIESVT